MNLKEYNFEEGELILIDKPTNWTSFDVVNKLRYATRAKKVGHAGTLDPLATGLLIICTGKYTKSINNYQKLDKIIVTHRAQLLFSKELLTEFIEVVSRPKLKKYFSKKDVDALLQSLEKTCN